MIDIRSEQCVEAVANAIGELWKTPEGIEGDEKALRHVAKAAIEAMLGQLQMSETQLRERVKCVSFNHENPYQERAAMQGYERALRDLGLVRDNEEDN